MRLDQPRFQSLSAPLRTKVLGAMAAVAAAMAREAPLCFISCAKSSTLVLHARQAVHGSTALHHCALQARRHVASQHGMFAAHGSAPPSSLI